MCCPSQNKAKKKKRKKHPWELAALSMLSPTLQPSAAAAPASTGRGGTPPDLGDSPQTNGEATWAETLQKPHTLLKIALGFLSVTYPAIWSSRCPCPGQGVSMRWLLSTQNTLWFHDIESRSPHSAITKLCLYVRQQQEVKKKNLFTIPVAEITYLNTSHGYLQQQSLAKAAANNPHPSSSPQEGGNLVSRSWRPGSAWCSGSTGKGRQWNLRSTDLQEQPWGPICRTGEMKSQTGLSFCNLPARKINPRHISLRLIEIKALYEIKMCRNNIFCLKN